MGKKTKKQKLLADYHRKLSQLNTVNTPLAPHVPSPSATSTSLQYKFPQPVIMSPVGSKVRAELDNTDYKFIYQDLRKILLLSSLAICAQFVLWYVVEKNLFKLF